MPARPVVETPSGTVVGATRAVGGATGPLSFDVVHTFLGIPYGRPPVGDLRFRPPVAAPRWEGVLDSTRFGHRAVQPPSLLAPRVDGEGEGEDCLVCNVWTPDLSGRLPVLVWIHGGSFTTGSGALSFYDGSRLAARGAVVVSVNYRLGALGFLHLAELDEAFVGTSNLGLQDQRLALDWVQRNVASFGGDPNRVTLFGESAGAMSVSLHVATDPDSPRFHRAIAQSGAAGHVQDRRHATDVARRVLELVGVRPGELQHLRDVPADAFASATATVSAERSNDVVLPFCPTVDGVVVADSPVALIEAGRGARVPLLSGTNRDEMNLFRLQAILAGSTEDMSDERLLARVRNVVAFWGADVDALELVRAYRDRRGPLTNGELWSVISTDATFRLPMTHMLEAHLRAGAPAWSYHFTHPSHAFDGALGAAHAVEIPFVFDNLHTDGVEFLLGPIGPGRHRLAAEMADEWVRFASADDPVAELRVPVAGERWTPYDPTRRPQALLDEHAGLVERHEAELLDLWIAGADPATGR